MRSSKIGKLENPPRSRVAEVNLTSKRLLVKDQDSGLVFLIDSGSDISLIPAENHVKRRAAQSCALCGKWFAHKNVWQASFRFKIGLRRPIQWKFCVASVPYPIIGADLLSAYDLRVDLRERKLIDKRSDIKLVGIMKHASWAGVSVVDYSTHFTKILQDFPIITDITQSNNVASSNVTHQIMSRIRTACCKACTSPTSRKIAWGKSIFSRDKKGGKMSSF